jgi:hypothetical protein
VELLDKVAMILKDIKDGLISEEDGLNRLEADFNQKERDDYRKQYKIATALSMYDVDKYVESTKNPEEIIIERERITRIVYFVKQILMIISKHYRDILWMYAVEKRTMPQIGRELGITKQTVYSYLKRIPYKVTSKMLSNDIGYSMSYVQEILEPIERHVNTSIQRQYGYPMDRIKASRGCIREYLDNSFKERVECNICYSCKDMAKQKPHKGKPDIKPKIEEYEYAKSDNSTINTNI